MSNSVACDRTRRPNVLNVARHQRDAGSSHRLLRTRSRQAAVRHVRMYAAAHDQDDGARKFAWQPPNGLAHIRCWKRVALNRPMER
jgi:hypothetical protein